MYKITLVKEHLIPGVGKYNYTHIPDPLHNFGTRSLSATQLMQP
jgi:hypothetical protein